MAKNSKSLLNKTSSKSKKQQDKYSEIPETKKKSKSEFKFQKEDVAIYTGNVIPENHGKKCKIIKLRNKYNQEYYLIEFEGKETLECHIDFLSTQEEYEQKQLNDIKNDENYVSVEIDSELIEQGIESLQNPLCCHEPAKFAEMRCMDCLKEPRCVYRYKHNYKKLNIW